MKRRQGGKRDNDIAENDAQRKNPTRLAARGVNPILGGENGGGNMTIKKALPDRSVFYKLLRRPDRASLIAPQTSGLRQQQGSQRIVNRCLLIMSTNEIRGDAPLLA